jgi:hypothetical protein
MKKKFYAAAKKALIPQVRRSLNEGILNLNVASSTFTTALLGSGVGVAASTLAALTYNIKAVVESDVSVFFI